MCAHCVRAAFYFIHHFNSYEVHTGKVHHLLLFLWAQKYICQTGISQDVSKICAAMVYFNILIIVHLTICAKFEQEHNDNMVSPEMREYLIL